MTVSPTPAPRSGEAPWLDKAEATLPPGVFRLLTVLDVTTVELAVFGPADRLVWANPAYRSAFGLADGGRPTFAELIRAGFAAGVGVRIDCGDVEAFLGDVLTRRRSAPQRGFATDLCNGEWRWIHETLLPDGWMVSVATDITPLKRLEQTLRAAHSDALVASRTDALTALANRRWILELLETERGLAIARGRPLSVAVLDVDYFKSINDSAGHEAGDVVLRTLASEAQAFFRRGDALGRPGGDEFLVVMPSASRQHGFSAVERFRERLALRIHQATGPAFTFSAGVAELQPEESSEGLLKRADTALYDAKSTGRGRTALAD